MNELDDVKKITDAIKTTNITTNTVISSSKSNKRPAMRLYTPPCNTNASSSSIKRSESLNESTNRNKNSLCVEDGDSDPSKESDRSKENLSKDEYYSVDFGDNQETDNKISDHKDSEHLRSNNRIRIDYKLSEYLMKNLSLSQSASKPSTSSSLKSSSLQLPSNSINDDEFSNMLEAYDLSPDLKSQDIRSSLYQLQSGDYEVRWVNDSRAIIIFSTKSIANEALKLSCHNLKLRKLSQGSAESKQKARQCNERLPFKQRPETSAFLARRLVSGALGIRVSVSAEKREAERKQIQDARDRQKSRQKQLQSAWDGD